MKRKAELNVAEVAKILNVDPQQVRYGIRNGTLPIGWYTQNENGRYCYHIVIARFCKFMRMTLDELQEKLKNNELEQNIA